MSKIRISHRGVVINQLVQLVIKVIFHSLLLADPQIPRVLSKVFPKVSNQVINQLTQSVIKVSKVIFPDPQSIARGPAGPTGRLRHLVTLLTADIYTIPPDVISQSPCLVDN